MTNLWLCILTATLVFCLFLIFKIRKQSSRIEQLEAVIRGRQEAGLKIPYESLRLLNSLRTHASQWAIEDTQPALLAVRPDFIELLDNYLSGVFSSLPELNNNIPIEPRPAYASLRTIHIVMFWFNSDDKAENPTRMTCASRQQAERIADLLKSKGIEATWTCDQSK